METAPEHCGRKRIHRYGKCCVELLNRVHGALKEEKSNKKFKHNVGALTDRMQYYTGVKSHSYLQAQQPEYVEQREHKENRHRESAVPATDRTKIRPAMLQIIAQRMVPSLTNIDATLRSENPSWRWSRSTLYRTMLGMKMACRDASAERYRYLHEEEFNVKLRLSYLDSYLKFEEETRPFIFMDESWIHSNHSSGRCWTDGSNELHQKGTGKRGNRFILIGAISSCGWVDNTFVMWKGTSSKEDYHSNMNGEVFEDWVNNRLLPNIPTKSVLVIDRASYHFQLLPECKLPPTNSTKAALVQWLLNHNARDENQEEYSQASLEGLSRIVLENMCHARRPQKAFKVNKWIDEYNQAHGTDIQLLPLPVAHPELNPIELAWGYLKNKVATTAPDRTMSDLKSTVESFKGEMNVEWFGSSYRHVRKIVQKYVDHHNTEHEEPIAPLSMDNVERHESGHYGVSDNEEYIVDSGDDDFEYYDAFEEIA